MSKLLTYLQELTQNEDQSMDNSPVKELGAEGKREHSREELEAQLAQLKSLAQLMDTQFKLPGTNIRLGADALIGLIPVVGDTLSLGISGYIMAQAARMGVPKRDLARMGRNLGVDWVGGMMPIIGDVFDIGWRANVRNVKIIEKRLKKQGRI